MRKIHTFLEFINEKYLYDILDEARFTPNRGQSAVAYLIGLSDALVQKKPTLKKSGSVTFDPVSKKYGKNFTQIYRMVFPEYQHVDWYVAIENLSNKIGVPKNTFNALSKRMTSKFMSRFNLVKTQDDSTVFYFDEIFDMDLDSLVNYIRKYIDNVENPEYTRKFKLETVSTELPELFSFLRPYEGKDILRAENFSLFQYPNVEDDRLTRIKKLQAPYDSAVCTQMIKSGLYSMQLDLTSIDLILYPKSSSLILKTFSQEINDFIKIQKEKIGIPYSPIPVLGDSFFKLKWKDVEVNEPSLERVGDIDVAYNFLVDIDRIKSENPEREFKFSDNLIPIRQRYLIGRFMYIPEDKIPYIKSANNILIIDDFTTGGSTRKQMKTLVKEQNPNARIISLSIFQIKAE